MFDKFVGFLIRFRVWGLTVMVLLTGFFGFQIRHMEMFTRFLDLFPKNHPFVQVHEKYNRYFGSAYQAQLVLEVKEGDVFNPETLEKISRIQLDVDLIPGVDHYGIFSLASPRATVVMEIPGGMSVKPIMPEVPRTVEGLAVLKKKVITSHHYGTLVSIDMKALSLNANFFEGRLDFNKLFKMFMEIKEREQDGKHNIYLTGQPILYGWIYYYLPQMMVIFVVTIMIILGLLFMYMRGIYWWIPFLTSIISAVRGLGFAAMWGFHFDPLIIVVPFLLSARAISHAVQWYERFVEEYMRHGDTEKAAHITGAGLFPPGLLGIVTDAAGLLVISLAPIPILKNLAYLGTAWALSVIFAVLIFLPMFFATLKNFRVPEKGQGKEGGILVRSLRRMTGWTYGRGRFTVVGIALVLLVFGIYSSEHLEYGDANPGSPIIWQDGDYNQDTKHVSERFFGIDQMWVVFEAAGEYPPVVQPELITGMERLKQYMMEDPNVGFALSFADLIKGFNMVVFGNDPKYESVPLTRNEVSDILNFYKMGAAAGDLDQWAEPALSATNVRIFLRDHKGTTLTSVVNRIMAFKEKNADAIGKAEMVPAGGLGGILAAANEEIAVKNDQLLIMVLGITFVLCALTYRSLLAGCMFVISLILANFLAFSYMVFKGIGLNINTLPVVSLGIGLGVDYGLYIISRVQETYREEKDINKAVVKAVTTSGRAVFMTATMMTVGVVFWYFSPLRFQAEMGILLGILMMSNMLVGILVLPAIVNILKPKFILRGYGAGA